MSRESDSPGYDAFPPPEIPIEVFCLHCHESYDSYLIEFRLGAGPDGIEGAWCCPTPECDGVGFCFDIWPTDPDWRDENGEKVCSFTDDEDEDEDFGEEYDLDAESEEGLAAELEDDFPFGPSSPEATPPSHEGRTETGTGNGKPPKRGGATEPLDSDGFNEDDIPF